MSIILITLDHIYLFCYLPPTIQFNIKGKISIWQTHTFDNLKNAESGSIMKYINQNSRIDGDDNRDNNYDWRY